MEMTAKLRHAASALALVVAGVALSGCLGDPTYGTDKSQMGHLADDLGNVISLPKNKAADITYQPRPGIVQPPKGEGSVLPPPEQSVASKGNQNWPESPEETRNRLVAEVNEQNGIHRNIQLGESPRAFDTGGHSSVSDAQTKQFRQALNVENHSYADRRFLSDPPEGLRQPAPTAPTDELGTPEKQKERERTAAAKKEKSGKSWWPW